MDETESHPKSYRSEMTSSQIDEALLLAQNRARAAEDALAQYDIRVEETAFRALALLEESRYECPPRFLSLFTFCLSTY